MLTGWLYRFHICKLLCISNFVGGGRKRLFIVHRTIWPSACTVIVFVTWYRHVLSVHKSVNKKTLNQTSYWSIFFPSLHYDANTVCYCCKDVLRPKCVLYAEKSRDGAGPWTAFKTYLVTRRKFKLTKLERKKIHYYKDKLCATWYRCSHRRPSSDE